MTMPSPGQIVVARQIARLDAITAMLHNIIEDPGLLVKDGEVVTDDAGKPVRDVPALLKAMEMGLAVMEWKARLLCLLPR